MRISRRVLVNAVAFAALAALLIVALALQVLPTVFGRSYSIYGIFTAAGGVATNQEVTYRGVQVGRVGEMTLTEDAVRIEMIIEAGHRIPREGTRARVLFKSAVGEQFVDLIPERDGAPYLEAGDVIPLERTSIPIQTEDLLRQLDAVLRSIDPAALGRLVHELGAGLAGHGPEIRDLILALDALARIGAGRRGELASLARDAARLQDAFNATRERFVEGSASLRAVLETVAERRGDIERTLQAARALDTDIIALLDARRAELNRILADLGEVVRIAHAHRGDLDATLALLGPFLADGVSAFDAPYFVFNLLANADAPACAYDPSSRPVRSVDDTRPKEPATEFECAGAPSASARRASGRSVPAELRARLERLSWLRLLMPAY